MKQLKAYDRAAAPHAHRTAWAYDEINDFYVLVYEDEAGKPIAFAAYTYNKWMAAVEKLMDAEVRRGSDVDGQH